MSAIKDVYKELGVRLFGYSDEKGRELVNMLLVQEYKKSTRVSCISI